MGRVFQFPFLLGIPLLPARRVIGIDAGTRCVRVALVQEFLGRVSLRRQQIIELQGGPDENPQDVQGSLAAAIRDIGDWPIALAVPQVAALSQTIDLPTADPTKVETQIANETRKLGGMTESALVYDYFKLAAFPPYQNPFWVALCQENEIQAVLERLGLSRSSLCEVVSSANARLTALLAIQPGLDKVLLVDIGASATLVTVLLGGQAVYTTMISIGGDAFTEAVARGQQCGFDAAEALKHAENLLEADGTPGELRETVNEWRSELGRVLEEWLAEHPGVARSAKEFRAILSGGGGSLPGFLELLNRSEEIRFAYWPSGPDASASWTAEFAVAHGAALQALGRGQQPTSLLPYDLRKTWKALKSTQFFLSLGVAFCVLFALLLVLATWQHWKLAEEKSQLLRQGQAALRTHQESQRVSESLRSHYERLRPAFEAQRQSADTLQALRSLQSLRQAPTNRPMWFVLFGDEQSYHQAQLPTNAATAALVATNLPAQPGTNAPTAISRRAFIAELMIDEEGDSLRFTLSNVVHELKSLALFANVDTLPAEQRRPLVDPKLVLPERHFALALELAPNEFSPPAPAPAASPRAKPPVPAPQPEPLFGPIPVRPPADLQRNITEPP